MNERVKIKRDAWQGVKVLFFLLFAQYYFNLVYYQHFHRNTYNRLEKHSHPYKDADHSHSSIDFYLIKSFSLLPFVAIGLFLLFKNFSYQERKLLINEKKSFVRSVHWNAFLFRGPPCAC